MSKDELLKTNYDRKMKGQKSRKIRRQNDDELVSEDIEALTFLGHSLLWTVDPKVKKAHQQFSYVWPACRTPKHPVWNINMSAIQVKM